MHHGWYEIFLLKFCFLFVSNMSLHSTLFWKAWSLLMYFGANCNVALTFGQQSLFFLAHLPCRLNGCDLFLIDTCILIPIPTIYCINDASKTERATPALLYVCYSNHQHHAVDGMHTGTKPIQGVRLWTGCMLLVIARRACKVFSD